MPEQIYIGNINQGLINAKLPFVIDNDAFPTLFNAYTWRGRVKRKRGTVPLGQLQIQEQIAAMPNNWQLAQFMLSSGAGNLITHYSLGTQASIVPGSLSLVVGSNTYTDTTMDGVLTGTPAGTGTINYATGAFTISGGASSNVTGTFNYYPINPVMGLRDRVTSTSEQNPIPLANLLYPQTLAFDTTNAYAINQTSVPFFYNVSYYKATNNPFVWSGANYQQFWTTNYLNAFWTTNGKPGFNFLTGTYSSGSAGTTITFNFQSGGVNFTKLVVGDVLWFNEWNAMGATVNGKTGTVSNISDAANGNYVVTFSASQTVSSTGIVQTLTISIAGKDGIKWYDGDPTGGTGLPTTKSVGWVNFAPPLTATTTTLETNTSALYYLIGATAIVPFKDRLLFFAPTISNSSGSKMFTLQDAVIWSQNGTPYYTVDASGNPVLVPTGETATLNAWYVDQTGLGGYSYAGVSQPVTTVSSNEDVLIVGFGGSRGRKQRLVYTSNDLLPFLFYNINSELPSDATFSAIALDKGVLDLGIYGIAMTDQQSSQRVDLPIPDEVFNIQNANNGVQRINAVRDFQKEWVYFSYPTNYSQWSFPTQTFLFNYRYNTWAILYENYTAHGQFRASNSLTWDTLPYANWDEWTDTWNSGISTALYPQIVAGNPQGYVLRLGEGTGEAPSGNISAMAAAGTPSGAETQLTVYNHCLTVENAFTYTGDYVYITGCIGQTGLNGLIAQVQNVIDANNFTIDIAYPGSGYLGLGVITKLSQPLIQTKQFNPYWEQGRQVRLSAQKYLMDFTAMGQVSVDISLSMDPDNAWNGPQSNPPPNSLVYSQIMYTCPESANIGLTAANTNLQMPTAASQYQIWHRFNTSLIGDTFQIGITLSDIQMRNLTYATSEITLHGMHLTCDKGPHLA